MDERIEDLLALYALGGLSQEETQEVEAYLAANPAAVEELDRLETAVQALPYAAVPLQPSAAVEVALMERVEADARRRAGAAATADVKESGRFTTSPSVSLRPSIFDWLRSLLATPVVSGAGWALALLLFVWAFVLLGRNNSLQSENSAMVATQQSLGAELAEVEAQNEILQAENEALQATNAILEDTINALVVENDALAASEARLTAEVENLRNAGEQLTAQLTELEQNTEMARRVLAILTSPDVDTVTIPGNPETQPQAQGQLVVDASSNMAILIVTGMEPLPEGSVYQVLLIQGSEHETAETFVVDTRGDSVLIVSSENPLGTFDAVGVSIEPEGGSEQRTGEVVILGSLAN